MLSSGGSTTQYKVVGSGGSGCHGISHWVKHNPIWFMAMLVAVIAVAIVLAVLGSKGDLTTSSSSSSTTNNCPACNPLCGPCGTTLTVPTGITVPSTWGQYWLTALAHNATQQAVIAVNGANNEIGWLTSNPLYNTWHGQMRTILQSIYGVGGDGFRGVAASPDTSGTNFPSYTYTQTGAALANPASGSPTWTSNYAGAGPSGWSVTTSGSSSTGATAWFYGYGSAYELFYGIDCYNDPTVTFEVTIDTIGTYYIPALNPSGCGSTGVNKSWNGVGWWTASIPAGSPALVKAFHQVLVVVPPDHSSELAGVRFTNPTGVIVDNYAVARRSDQAAVHAGEGGVALFTFNNSYWWNNSVTGYPNSPMAWSGGGSTAAQLFIWVVNPWDILDAINAGSNFAYTLYHYVLLPVVTNQQADVLVIFPIFDVYTSSIYINSIFANQTSQWATWKTQLGTYFATSGIASIDMQALFGSYTAFRNAGGWGNAQTPGAGGSLYPFLSDQGHYMWAQQIWPVITGQYGAY